MLDNLKSKIKLKLRDWLEVSNLEKELDKHKENTYRKITRNENDINYNLQAINTIHTTLENVVHIGTDVRPYGGHSWAVICIEGKMNMVKFVDLDRADARDVLHFVKRYEGGRHCIDAPQSEFFYEGMFKFK